MGQIAEILGAVNFWLSPKGEAHSVSDHTRWACQNILHCNVPDTLVSEPIYRKAKNLGWVRIAIQASDNEMWLDYSRLNEHQLAWIESEAIRRKVRVVDDRGHTMMDFSEGHFEALAAATVAQLLS